MEIASLDDFMALNDQLAALISAGVPLQLGLESLDESPSDAFERINATVARRVSRGATLAEALRERDSTMPETYRNVMLVGIESGDMHAALNAAAQLAQTVDRSRNSIRGAYVYPLVVCVLAVMGLAGFSTYVAPRLEGLRENLRLPKSDVARTLPWLRVAVFGIAIVAAVAALFWGSRRLVGDRGRNGARAHGIGPVARLLGGAAAARQARRAAFAESLAALTATSVPLGDALSVAANASGDWRLRRGAEQVSIALRKGGPLSEDDSAAATFPPFLKWALLRSEPAVRRPQALEMAADVYRQSARRLTARVAVVAPMVLCALVGGSVVLLYGLTLFIPLIDLLKGLALTATH
jgi:general secretion pathway protein F